MTVELNKVWNFLLVDLCAYKCKETVVSCFFYIGILENVLIFKLPFSHSPPKLLQDHRIVELLG